MSNKFTLSKFYDLIFDYGVDMKYYQSTICSCIADNEGQPDPECDCYNGFRYPTRPVTKKLLRTSVDYKSLPESIGHLAVGSCQISVPDKTKIYSTTHPGSYNYVDNIIYDNVNIGDIFVIDNRDRRDRDILKKGVRDRINAFDVQNVISVSKGNITYAEGTDYEFLNYLYPDPFWYISCYSGVDNMDLSHPDSFRGGEIVWLTGGKAPSTDENYTVEFTSKIQYIVWKDLTKDRGSDDDLLPKRLICNLRQYVHLDKSVLDDISL